MRKYPETSIEEHFRNAMTHCDRIIASTPHDRVIAADPEGWTEEICAQSYLPRVEEAGDPHWTHKTSSEVYEDYGRRTEVEVQYMVVHWPLKHDPNLLNLLSLRPSLYYGSLPEISYWEGELQFRIRIGTLMELDREHVQDAARKKLEEAIKNLREEFAARNKDIEKWAPALRQHIAEAIKRRKEQVGQKDSAMEKLAASMPIPLRKKSEAPPKVVYLSAGRPAARSASPAASAPPVAEDMILDRGGFSTLLSSIERYLRDCERTPRTFAKLEEEEVRNLLLPHLNQVFEGGATGETFSKTGKTDIYLVVKKGCILICECKWWRGPKSVEEVTEQILKRVTWRENFGIALVFVKTDFDSALERIRQAVKALSWNKSQQVREISKGHLSATLVLPEAESKIVEVHYLVCNFSG